MEFKCVMSLEKAIVIKEHPQIFMKYLEFKHNSKINIENIYYKRDDKNLKMKNVILYIEYNIN